MGPEHFAVPESKVLKKWQEGSIPKGHKGQSEKALYKPDKIENRTAKLLWYSCQIRITWIHLRRNIKQSQMEGQCKK